MAKDESRQIGASYGLTDISDGNKQQEFSTFWRERLFAAPHHITYGTVRGFTAVIAKIKLLILAQVRITARS